jgi:hypothetical protein
MENKLSLFFFAFFFKTSSAGLRGGLFLHTFTRLTMYIDNYNKIQCIHNSQT